MALSFGNLFGARKLEPPRRSRLSAIGWPEAVYAVGDIHGCVRELMQVQKWIAADAASIDGEKLVVFLGDYVDRGPRSADVIDMLMATPPAGMRRVCLAGNHETMMLGYLAQPKPRSDWLEFGGIETLQSYGINTRRYFSVSARMRQEMLDSHIPGEHIDFLRGLPTALSLPGVDFVHAGILPGIPMDQQHDADLLWIREPFLSDTSERPTIIVHGHTPTPEPVITRSRIGLDTGAFATGVLTAARISAGGVTALFSTSSGAQ